MPTQLDLAQKLRDQMETKGTKPAELAALCGVKAPSVYDWMKFGRIAKSHLPKLAAFFGTPLAYWLGDDEEDVNPLERQLLTLSRSLPDEMQDELLRYANYLHNQADGNRPSAANPFPKPPPKPKDAKK